MPDWVDPVAHYMLEQYEERLSLFKKHERRKQLLDQLKQCDLPGEALVIIETLEQLE